MSRLTIENGGTENRTPYLGTQKSPKALLDLHPTLIIMQVKSSLQVIFAAFFLGLTLLSAFDYDLGVSKTLDKIDLLRDDSIDKLKQLIKLSGAMGKLDQPNDAQLHMLVIQAAAVKNNLAEINDLKAQLAHEIEALRKRTRLPIYRGQLERFKKLYVDIRELEGYVHVFKNSFSRIRTRLDALVNNNDNYKRLMREALDW